MFATTKNAILLGCLVATSSLAQDPPFRTNVEIVVAPFSVVDETGATVRDLSRSEFRVFDNGLRRHIESLWIDNNQPLTLGVIIDTSESQKEHVRELRQTVVEVLAHILQPGDRVFVISVDENVRLWIDVIEAPVDIGQRLTSAPSEELGEPCGKGLRNAPGVRPLSPCGSTRLWDAVYAAARLKLESLTGNKALLILTDGFDGGSTHSWNQAADAVIRANATIYAVQYRSAFGRSFAPDLYRLVAESGGTWFRAPSTGYGPVINRIETDLRHRYILGFRPERLSGKARHEIRVEVSRPNLKVRGRRTYFDFGR